VCPRLGFADDPMRNYSRPTALHRCYASITPSLVTLQEQRELCLSGQYPTCQRFRTASRSSRPVIRHLKQPEKVPLACLALQCGAPPVVRELYS